MIDSPESLLIKKKISWIIKFYWTFPQGVQNTMFETFKQINQIQILLGFELGSQLHRGS